MGDQLDHPLDDLEIIEDSEIPYSIYTEPTITQSDSDLLLRPPRLSPPIGCSTPVLNKKITDYLDEVLAGIEEEGESEEQRLNSDLEIKNQHYQQQTQYKRSRIDKNLLAIDYDGILQLTGGCKKWQIMMYCIISLQQIPHAMFNLSVVYMMYTQEHWCKVPGFTKDEVTNGNRGYSWLDFLTAGFMFPMKTNDTVPNGRIYAKSGFSQCNMYKRDYSLYNLSSWAELQGFSPTDEIVCTNWEYDTSVMRTTVVSQYNLLCDENMSRAHLHLAYSLGYLVGTVVGGFVSDKFGRKYAILLYGWISLVFGIALYGTDNFYVFLFIRFCLAISNEAGDIAAYVYCMEITGTEYRSIVGSLMHAPWALGYSFLALIGYFTKSWVAIHVITLTLHFVALIFLFFLDESPRWLIVQNDSKKRKQAESIIRTVCRLNKTTLPSDLGIIKHAEMEKWKSEHTTMRQLMTFITSKKLIYRSIALFIIWAATALVYYGLVIALSDQSSDEKPLARYGLFFSNAIAGALEIPTLLVGCFVLMRFGRKVSLITCLGVSALSLLVSILVNDSTMFLFFFLLAKCSIQGAFNILYIFTTELSPTVLRNSFIGMNSMISRLGSGASGYIAILSDTTFPKIPMMIFAGLSLAASLFVFTLPETANSPLPDTIWDAVKLHNPRSQPCLGGEMDEEEKEEERRRKEERQRIADLQRSS